MFHFNTCILLALCFFLGVLGNSSCDEDHDLHQQVHKNKPCFMKGDFDPPKDVVINDRVTCLPGEREPFKGVPNVLFNGLRYSEYDFQQDTSLSPVGYALRYLTPNQYGNEMVTILEGLVAVYGATNAGLRSYGPKQKLNVGKLKGPNFYLEFHLAIAQKNMQLAAHKLQKVLKNCYRCTKAQRDLVLGIAKKNNVELPKSTSTLTSTSNSTPTPTSTFNSTSTIT